MASVFRNNAHITLIYFYDEESKSKKVIFDGSIEGFREDLTGGDWRGFDLGDRFLIDNDKVRVYKKEETRDEEGIIISAVYYVAPHQLNPNNVNYENFKKPTMGDIMKETCYKCGEELPKNHDGTVCDECFDREIKNQ